ncbi:hypothetical protein RD792_008723 [Penstemon davidsonii]|uniref:HMA domain-containing protein n=1 Tax=Penstemon davidsonii TaxID=160366 RepID=A0ABR0DB67_9LAMI|nr:hypothetical protein RD792_008723 [Penstemon davidsonii]
MAITNEEQNPNPKGNNIVLGVYIHCEGCGNQVLKSLRGFEGVEEIEIDEKNHKVIVKGKNVDPVKVTERLRKKSGKRVELISPKPKKEEKKEEKKPQLKVNEVVLKIYIHCEGCAKEVKNCIHKMEGVRIVDIDMVKNVVTVKGTMDPQKLVDFIKKRGGKHAEIVKKGNKGSNGENEQKDQNVKIKDDSFHYYPQELVYAPQLFSDENPNSCSVM